MDLELPQSEIPTAGIKPKKILAFIDLIERYLGEKDKYNNKAVYDGLFPALEALSKNKPLLQVIRSMDEDLSCFQLNWVFNTLGEYAIRGEELQKIWAQYQKSIEPKKKPSRRREVETPEEF